MTAFIIHNCKRQIYLSSAFVIPAFEKCILFRLTQEKKKGKENHHLGQTNQNDVVKAKQIIC